MNKLIIFYTIVLMQTASIGVGFWFIVGDDLIARSQEEQESSRMYSNIAAEIESGKIVLTKDKLIFTFNNLAESSKHMDSTYVSYDQAFREYLWFIFYAVILQAIILFGITLKMYNKQRQHRPAGWTR